MDLSFLIASNARAETLRIPKYEHTCTLSEPPFYVGVASMYKICEQYNKTKECTRRSNNHSTNDTHISTQIAVEAVSNEYIQYMKKKTRIKKTTLCIFSI